MSATIASYDAFVVALLEAGWRPQCDAQHTGARALYERLYDKPAALDGFNDLSTPIETIEPALTFTEFERSGMSRQPASHQRTTEAA